MRVLISAYACEPGRGAEPGVGWNIAKKLSENHELWIITRANNKDVIESCEEEWASEVNWIYVDPPRWLTFWKKGMRGLRVFYTLWQVSAYRAAKKLVQDVDFDLVHHVTFGKYWIPSPLAGLNIPFVFGPVGGGESTPAELLDGCSLKTKMAESGRTIIRNLIPRLPWINRWYKNAAWTFAATEQTMQELQDVGVERVSVLRQSGVGRDEVERFSMMEPRSEKQEGKLVLVAACRLVNWKAVDLAIEAVHAARKMGHDVELTVLQEGPELVTLKNLRGRLGMGPFVDFKGRLPSLQDVYQTMINADALIHPALHEAFGQVCVEALALGVPVITMDWAGPGMIVNDQTGYLVRPGDRQQTVQRFAEAIAKLAEDKKLGVDMSDACRKRASEEFRWSALVDTIEQRYEQVSREQDVK